jgi:hypothetical protein
MAVDRGSARTMTETDRDPSPRAAADGPRRDAASVRDTAAATRARVLRPVVAVDVVKQAVDRVVWPHLLVSMRISILGASL